MVERTWYGARKKPAPVARTPREMTALVAAAGPVPVSTRSTTSQTTWGGVEWQSEAWLHYRVCGELRQAATIIANSLSRVQVIAVDVDPVTGKPATTPTEDQTAAAVVRQMFGGPEGQSQAMSRIGRHLTIGGESWVLGTDSPDGVAWELISPTKCHARGDGVEVTRGDGSRYVVDPAADIFFPVRQSDPEEPWRPDSAVRSLLPVLRELGAVSAAISAMTQSRLIMNGMLVIPDEADPPPVATDLDGSVGFDAEDVYQEPTGANKGDRWVQSLMDIASQNLAQPGSAAAALPIVATMAKDLIDSMKMFDFGHDIDGALDALRQSAIRRLATGLDLPPEVLLGLGDSTHWNAWQVSESYVTTYINPLLEVVAYGFSNFYARPAFRAVGLDPTRFAVGFDVSDLLPEQLDAGHAQDAFDRGELKAETYRRALGFSEADAPDDNERLRRVMLDFARSNPQSIAEMLPSLQKAYPGVVLAPIPPVQELPAGARESGPPTPPPTTPPGVTP